MESKALRIANYAVAFMAVCFGVLMLASAVALLVSAGVV